MRGLSLNINKNSKLFNKNSENNLFIAVYAVGKSLLAFSKWVQNIFAEHSFSPTQKATTLLFIS